MHDQSLRRLPNELRLFIAIVSSITCLVWLAVAITRLLHVTAPYVWPLAPPGASFYDFTIYLGRFRNLHHPEFFSAPGYPFTYFAPGVLLYGTFYAFGHVGGLLVYMGTTLTALVVAFVVMRRSMLKYRLSPLGVTVFLLIAITTSYPISFAIERGNLEVILAIGMALGTWAYWRGETWTAAIIWGLFGSVKLYPLLLLAVFLSFRQYR